MTEENTIEILHNHQFSKQATDILIKSGYTELRNIQIEAIKNGLFEEKSLLIFAPSGSGKTLIAEMAAVNNIMNSFKKSIYLVPLRSLAYEKYEYFNKIYSKLNLQITIAVGDMDIPRERLEVSDLIVLTYEKFDSFLRKEHMSFFDISIGTIIIDEIHVLGDYRRGPRLESLIMRIYQMHEKPQVIGLSATISNPELLEKWFNHLEKKFRNKNIELIKENHRPVELKHYVLKSHNKEDKLKEITYKTLIEDGQVLIFTNSRRKTWILANKIKEYIQFKNPILKTEEFDILEYKTFLTKLKSQSMPKDSIDLVKYGVFYHHAGLRKEDKEIIEFGFRKGYLKVLCTTTTLSTGVNLPARTVILHNYNVYNMEDRNLYTEKNHNTKKRYKKTPIARNLFHQICGRAGRPGLDPYGYAFILVEENEEYIWVRDNYFHGNKLTPNYDPLKSNLLRNNEIFEELVLLKIYDSEHATITELISYFKDTLMWQEKHFKDIPIECFLNIDQLDSLLLLKMILNKNDLETLGKSILEINLKKHEVDKFYGIIIQNHKIWGDINNEETINYIKIELRNLPKIQCSCSEKKKIPKRLPIKYLNHKNGIDQLLCPHIKFLFYSLENLDEDQIITLNLNFDLKNEILNKLSNAIQNQIFKENIIHILLKYNLITKHKLQDCEYDLSCTELGNLTINHYLTPKLVNFIDNYVAKRLKSNKPIPQGFSAELMKKIMDIKNDRIIDNFDIILKSIDQNIRIEEIYYDVNKLKENDMKRIEFSDLNHFIETLNRITKFLIEYFDAIYPNLNIPHLDKLHDQLRKIDMDFIFQTNQQKKH